VIKDDELPVRERQATSDALHHALVVRGFANLGPWWLGESVRCRALQAHGKIGRRHSIFLLVESPDWRRKNDTSRLAAIRRAYD
jgi:hypothetical protein